MNNYGFDFMPVLSRGSHTSPARGACVMEMVSFLSGDMWTDTPECSLNEISHVAQIVNDELSDENRHLILSQFHRLFNTSEIEMDADMLDSFAAGFMGIIRKWSNIYVPESGLSRFYWEDAYPVFEMAPFDAMVAGDLVNLVVSLLGYVESDEDKVQFLAEVLDLADEVLGRDEVVPVDTSRISQIPSILEEV